MQARVAAHGETRRATDGPLRFDHDGIPGTIREEPDLIAVLKAQRLEIVHGQIQVVGSAAARSAEADVRGPRLRIGKLDELRAGQFAGLEFKARRIADFAGSDDGRPLFADNNGVAVLKADMRHGAFQCKGIEVERAHFLPLAQYADIAVAAALGVDAARLVEEGEDGIGRRARIIAGAGHEAGHEDRDGLGVHRADIHLHIDHARRVELALDGLFKRFFGIDGQARHRHAPDIGNGDHALGIDGQDIVHRASAPQTHDQAVAALYDLTG